MTFVGALPADTREAVCVVLHLAGRDEAMPHIFGWAAYMPVHSPADGEALLGGR